MDASNEREPTPPKNRTTVEQTSERELVVTRIFDAPARIVFEAWTKPELACRHMKRLPASIARWRHNCATSLAVLAPIATSWEEDG